MDRAGGFLRATGGAVQLEASNDVQTVHDSFAGRKQGPHGQDQVVEASHVLRDVSRRGGVLETKRRRFRLMVFPYRIVSDVMVGLVPDSWARAQAVKRAPGIQSGPRSLKCLAGSLLCYCLST